MNIICTTSGAVETCDYSSLAPLIWLAEFFVAVLVFFLMLYLINYLVKKVL